LKEEEEVEWGVDANDNSNNSTKGLSGPRGTRQKKLQNWDPVELEGRPKGHRAY
jgi:hypothetical protein